MIIKSTSSREHRKYDDNDSEATRSVLRPEVDVVDRAKDMRSVVAAKAAWSFNNGRQWNMAFYTD